ncbi:retrotransposon protein, putative, ty1-copia subclass [Tanacetum coccineum]
MEILPVSSSNSTAVGFKTAREINALCAHVIAIVDERENFVDELDMLVGRPVPGMPLSILVDSLLVVAEPVANIVPVPTSLRGESDLKDMLLTDDVYYFDERLSVSLMRRRSNGSWMGVFCSRDIHVILGEPANYKTAMLDPDKVIWQGAMDEEMKSMKVNKVWIVIDRPPNAKVVRSKWIFKKKTDMDAIAAYYDYEIWQMDVKTAFLNGRLDEDIYMEQPEGYVDPNYPNGVCKLQRAIYG